MYTADLCDRYPDRVRVCRPVFRDFGARTAFRGPVSTVKCHEDNSRVAEAIAEPGQGRVLAVDGSGSLRRALLGDRLAGLAADNGWAGIIVNGCIRDSRAIAGLDLGVKALSVHPAKSVKLGEGVRNTPVEVAGVLFEPGPYVYADSDGVVLAAVPLHVEQ